MAPSGLYARLCHAFLVITVALLKAVYLMCGYFESLMISFYLLQEHWLLPFKIDILSNFHGDFLATGSSAVDINQNK